MIKVEITENGEFVWAGLIDSGRFNELIDMADKLSDESVESDTSTQAKGGKNDEC